MTQNSKTALITGGTSGIGLDAARGFLEKEYSVVINGRDYEKINKAVEILGNEDRVIAISGDIGDPETGRKMVKAAIERFGNIDVLVNNAGIFGLKSFLEITEKDLDQYINGNLKGTYFVTQAVVRQMKQQGWGSIVNIGTVLIMHPSASIPASAALITKGGIHALTTSLASELAADNIRVNAVAPGVIRTPIHNGFDVDTFGFLALQNRVGEVQEITDTILHLATAGFTTGVILPVDGGYVHGRA